MMKKILYIIVSICAFQNCGMFKCDTVKYTITNQSDYDILIVGYLGNTSDSIPISSKTSHEIIKGGGECSNGTVGFFNLYNVADSASIIFDNSKIITYYNKDFSQENILQYHSSNFETNCSKNKGCDYEYIITNDQYNVALTFTE